MDPEDVNRKLTFQTKAIIVQHTYGIPADVDRIVQIAAQNGHEIIEDCCPILVSAYKSETVGSFRAADFYSFEMGIFKRVDCKSAQSLGVVGRKSPQFLMRQCISC